MSVTQVPYTSFGGLLTTPGAESEPGNHAVDGLNFELADGYQVRVRDQVRALYSCPSTAATPFTSGSIYDDSVGKQYTLVAQRSGLALSIYGDSGSGPSFVTSVTPTGNPEKIIPFGTPSQRAVLLLARATPAQKLVMPSTLSSPTVSIVDPITGAVTVGGAMPASYSGALWGQQGRTVFAGFNGVTSGPNGLPSSFDHVWFSEPGDPTKFRSDAFVVVGAGDGEFVTSVETIGDYLIVFKETKFYVFYGVSSSARGVPIFNYRVADYGVGTSWRNGSCRGRDGVYFVAADGIYVTRGDKPQRVSQALDGLFTGAASQAFQGVKVAGVANNFVRIVSVDDRVYVSLTLDTVASGLVARTLVGDLRHGWWAIWRTAGNTDALNYVGKYRDYFGAYRALHPYKTSGGAYFWGPTLEGQLNTEPIADAFYQSAFVDVASDSRARVRQVEVWGSGTPTVKLRGDFRPAVLGQGQVNLDTKGVAFMRKAVVGQRISTGLYNEGGVSSALGFRVSRYVHHIPDKRVASAL